MSWFNPTTLGGRLRTLWRPAAVFLAPGPQAQAEGAALGMSGAEAVVPGHDQALLAWRDWCQAHAGQHCLLGLSGQWLLQAAVAATDAADADQALAVCQQRWAHYFNVDADELATHWVLRSVPVHGGWLMCALPVALKDDLLAVAQASQVGIGWMGPWWARCGQRWQAHALKQKDAPSAVSSGIELLAQEPGWSTSLRLEGGQMAGLWARQDSPEAQSASTVAHSANGLGASTVTRLRMAAADAAVPGLLWDNAPTRSVLTGRAEPWLALA